jgi:hypothetical protein
MSLSRNSKIRKVGDKNRIYTPAYFIPEYLNKALPILNPRNNILKDPSRIQIESSFPEFTSTLHPKAVLRLRHSHMPMIPLVSLTAVVFCLDAVIVPLLIVVLSSPRPLVSALADSCEA